MLVHGLCVQLCIGRGGTILAATGHQYGCVSRRVDQDLPNLFECLDAAWAGTHMECGRLLAEDAARR